MGKYTDPNIIEQERELKHKIRSERNPRARKFLRQRLRRVQEVKIPTLTLVK